MTRLPEKPYNLMEFFIKNKMVSNIKCKDCGSTATRIIGKLPNVNEFAGRFVSQAIVGGYLMECKNCSLKFRSTEFEQSALNEMYDGGVSEWEVAENRNDWKILNSYIENNYSTAISILDIGCNQGEILDRLAARHKRYGLEINTRAAAIAKKRKGLVIWDKYNQIPHDIKFDVIFSTDVLEHISSPSTFLAPLFNLLKDDGVLIITTGDANNLFSKAFGSKWWYCYFPEHVSFISKKWINNFSKNQHISIKEIKRYYYHNINVIKRLRLLVMSAFFFFLNSETQRKVLSFIHKTENPARFQLGKSVSKDHIFVVLQKK